MSNVGPNHTGSGQGNLPRAEVERMEQALAQHYGEPVRPISELCDRLMDYVRALSEGKASQRDHFPASPFDADTTDALIRYGGTIITYARKSNLLFRLLYLRQPLRTVKCPEHDGHWSGCHAEQCPHGCSVGYDVTGWLPAPAEETREQQ